MFGSRLSCPRCTPLCGELWGEAASSPAALVSAVFVTRTCSFVIFPGALLGDSGRPGFPFFQSLKPKWGFFLHPCNVACVGMVPGCAPFLGTDPNDS